MGNEVSCSSCGFPLGEKGGLPLPERGPCPQCGGTGRRIAIGTATEKAQPIHATGTPATIRAEARVFPPTIQVDEPSIEALEEVATVSEIVKEVRWINPTDEEGSYTCMAFDGQGNLLAMAEHRDWEDALLAVVEELGPGAS